MPLIAIIEDEQDILELLNYQLRREGFDVITASSGETGLNLIRKQKPDLVLLDLMLPQRDGLDICREIKNSPATQHIPVVIVSAKSDESDVVLGLGMLADDYIRKPFSPRELIARVRNILRRSSKQLTDELNLRIEYPNLVIDANKHKVSYFAHEIQLTATEFRMLHYLANHPGRVFSREQLLNQTIGENVVVVDRNVDVHIRSIRKKLEEVNHGKTDVIETIRGVGYRFREFNHAHG